MRRVYRAVADMRYYLRRYVDTTNRAAEAAGVTSQQYLLMLTIAGMPENMLATVGNVAERLVLEPNTAVELIDRAEAAGHVRRAQDPADRRFVLISLTPSGERIMAQLASYHFTEIQRLAPDLIQAMNAVIAQDFTGEFGDVAT